MIVGIMIRTLLPLLIGCLLAEGNLRESFSTADPLVFAELVEICLAERAKQSQVTQSPLNSQPVHDTNETRSVGQLPRCIEEEFDTNDKESDAHSSSPRRKPKDIQSQGLSKQVQPSSGLSVRSSTVAAGKAKAVLETVEEIAGEEYCPLLPKRFTSLPSSSSEQEGPGCSADLHHHHDQHEPAEAAVLARSNKDVAGMVISNCDNDHDESARSQGADGHQGRHGSSSSRQSGLVSDVVKMPTTYGPLGVQWCKFSRDDHKQIRDEQSSEINAKLDGHFDFEASFLRDYQKSFGWPKEPQPN